MKSTELQDLHYSDAIHGMAEYAKSIGFDPYTGDFDKFANDWINHTKKMHDKIMQNKENVICVIKQII